MNKQKIALIEDDRVLSDALYVGLKDAGFDVDRAFDGVDGLAMVLEKKPALVLLNIIMPKIDGLTVAKKLKNNPETKNIPIIILTVLGKTESVAEALDVGVYEYLVKADYKVEDIVKRVKEYLKVKKYLSINSYS